MNTGGWIFTALWTVIILAILAAAVVWIVSALRSPDTAGPSGGLPREILDRRLAKGELTVEQYKQLRDAIGGDSSPPDHRPPRPAGVAG